MVNNDEVRVTFLNGTKPVKVTVVPMCTESFSQSFFGFLNIVTAQNYNNDFSNFPEVRIS